MAPNPLSPGPMLYVLDALHLTRQAAEHPLFAVSLLYVLYVLYLTRQATWRLHLPAHVGLQRLEGHGLRHVEVALPRKSVQLPRVPHVEVVGQVPQRLHLVLPQKGACARFPVLLAPKRGLLDAGRPERHLLVAPKRSLSKVPWTHARYLFFGPAAPARLPPRPAGPGHAGDQLGQPVLFALQGARASSARCAAGGCWVPLK